MSISVYLLGVIGEKCKGQSYNDDTFIYENASYQLLIDINIERFLRDIKYFPDFVLREKSSEDEEYVYLELYFQIEQPSRANHFYSKQINAKKRIIYQFFTVLDPDIKQNHVLSPSEENNKNEFISIKDLYAKLREAHMEDNLCEERIPASIQQLSLKPLLRPYQRDAVKWLLNRELNQDFIQNEYVEITANAICERIFYINPRTLDLLDFLPNDIELPTGGILADEMGLGKTVEMLALILSNKRENFFQLPLFDHDGDIEIAEKGILQCICSRTDMLDKDLIVCTKCFKQQHKGCVQKISSESLLYICPECWKYQNIIESGATFIVSPLSIKKQWELEIKKHVLDPNFKVLVYDGIKNSGWICPYDLANYDVVLTDYKILQSEIYFTNTNGDRQGSLRHAKRFLKPVSPLPLIRWWRVCLDEAQMVESPSTKSAQMVKTLPAIHRWSVTGTPIEKSINNLYGLIDFLDCEPYCYLDAWKKISIPFTQGNSKPLIDFLRKIMWRTCKSVVLDQIGIPVQKEIVHYVNMSDLQIFFYRTQHAKCSEIFMQKAYKLGNELAMSKMNPHVLKLLLEPLRKLRQDCTVPSILYKNDQTIVKKILSPDELLVHLISNNELEAKAQLRTIASSLNGMAAIHCIRKEYKQAIKLYKAVLRRAKDYTGNICVDSLLQIHALHNLLEIIDLPNDSNVENDLEIIELKKEKEEYKNECKKLEGKYMEVYYVVVKTAEEQVRLATEAVIELENKLGKNYGGWWHDILYLVKQESQLVEKVTLEIATCYSNLLMEENFRTVDGIAIILTMWLEKLLKFRKDVQMGFKKLKYFTKNLKTNYDQENNITKKDQLKIENLIKMALECHLNPFLDDDQESVKKQKILCQLCQVKHSLGKYESIIFDKVFLENRSDTEGTWNPSYQEWILKTLCHHVKKEKFDVEVIKEADLHLTLLEAYKKEYKEYSQYWVEINYTASRFDELNMCKSRLQVVDPDEIDESRKRSMLQISTYEIDETAQQFQMQLNGAEKEFQRILGTLKYFNHLGKNTTIDLCPICKQKPENKYCVLECGHHLCMVCLIQMTRFQRQNLNCSICRYRQKLKDIYYVTCGQEEDSVGITVRGNYSGKIMEIVKTILQLRENDAKVKIIIFSHWENILDIISKACIENAISIRMKSAKFHKSIDDFKSNDLNITCLLLPLTCGSKGLNLIEATHVFLVEPILNPGEELQALGRVHRIGQTKPTFIHRFIVRATIEETIFNTISNDKSGKWESKDITVDNLKELFHYDYGDDDDGADYSMETEENPI